MRILHVLSHLNIGGVSSYVLSLSAGLRRRGHTVVVGSDRGALEPQLAASGIPQWRVPLHTKAEFSPRVFAAGRQLARRLRREPADLIHAHTRVAQVVAARLSRRLGIPYVTTWHGFFRPNLGRRLWPCLGERTIAISEPVRQHLLRVFRVPEERLRLIPNGVDAAHFSSVPEAEAVRRYRQRHGLPAGRTVVGSIGRLAGGGVKGFDLLLEAARRLRPAVPDLHVLIVGEGPRRAFLQAQVRRLGLGGLVHLVGAEADIRLPLAAMDVFVFPVRWQEGFGLSLIEAMAAGRPVVASRIGAVPEIVEHGRSGWLVEPEDPAALADAIARALVDPAAAEMGRQAQARVRTAFTLEQMVGKVEAVYREVAE